jgi:hypothetical protein
VVLELVTLLLPMPSTTVVLTALLRLLPPPFDLTLRASL